MSIPIQAGVQAFIASTPRLTCTDSGRARFYARVRCERWCTEANGSLADRDATSQFVTSGTTAERAYARFHRGDRFVDGGCVHEYEVEASAVAETREELFGRHVGHDLSRTTYEVQGRRADPPGPAATAEPACAVVGL